MTRAVIFELAKSLVIPIGENSLVYEDLAKADEAFLTNSLIEVQPLIKVGEQRIGQGEIGPITTKIQKAFHQLTCQS